MDTQLATNGHVAPPVAPLASQLLESVLLCGDLSKLTAAGRVDYYRAVCESMGLNPLTKPFDYLYLQNRLTLYANRNAAEQLRARDNISVRIVAREAIEGVFLVTVEATNRTGRSDQAIGAVPIAGLGPADRANVFMKAETKAKRRVTLSICGLGMVDESEVDTIPGARRANVDLQTGEIEAAGIDTGGHHPGTQAAADHVAQRRIAELKTKGSPQMESMRRALQEASQTIGEQAAGIILGNFGLERIDEIADLEVGRMVYKALVGYSRSVRQRN